MLEDCEERIEKIGSSVLPCQQWSASIIKN
jgi:hypothetical protein